ncbi:hypothetical protein [Rossellomorea marisflavi]|uniref:hypothetical protein n=1 Tax=Rossellomorea marisflavi TaxID=189381 RepID=UPI00345AE80D
MSVELKGVNELIKDLERIYGKGALQQRVDAALLKGAEVFKAALIKEFNRFKDTGASLEEITISEPMDFWGNRTVRIHWQGDKGRYRIIHLTEFGTVKNPNPKGKGAIAKAERSASEAYFQVIKEELGRG